MKLLDKLETALIAANIRFERDGWTETIGGIDKCEWLDIIFDKDNVRHTIHFYFTDNSEVLDSIQIWKSDIVSENDIQIA